jgi:hypothetical protein
MFFELAVNFNTKARIHFEVDHEKILHDFLDLAEASREMNRAIGKSPDKSCLFI